MTVLKDFQFRSLDSSGINCICAWWTCSFLDLRLFPNLLKLLPLVKTLRLCCILNSELEMWLV